MTKVPQPIIDLYDNFTHGGMDRRAFLDRLTKLAGGATAIAGPVGFVGSAQSKQELIERPRGMAYLVVTGRRGGSAMAAAAVNAIASERE